MIKTMKVRVRRDGKESEEVYDADFINVTPTGELMLSQSNQVRTFIRNGKPEGATATTVVIYARGEWVSVHPDTRPDEASSVLTQ